MKNFYKHNSNNYPHKEIIINVNIYSKTSGINKLSTYTHV